MTPLLRNLPTTTVSPKRLSGLSIPGTNGGAPLKRNEKIVETADLIIALWDGKSRGTKYVIDHAKKLEKRVEIYILEKRYYSRKIFVNKIAL